MTIESDVPMPLIMPNIPRKKTLDELKSEAIAELERLGMTFAAKHRRKMRGTPVVDVHRFDEDAIRRMFLYVPLGAKH